MSRVKAARAELFVAYKNYRRAVQVTRLEKKRDKIVEKLSALGIRRKQIPVVFMPSRAFKIPVRKGV